jgi:hypothetical protein
LCTRVQLYARQLMNRIIRVIAALGTGATLAACGSGTQGSPSGSRPPVERSAQPTTSAGTVACKSGQLKATVVGPGGAAGVASYVLSVRNVGSDCALGAIPATLHAANSSVHRRIPIRVRLGRHPTERLDLGGRSATAYTTIRAATGCSGEGSERFNALVLTLRGGGSLRARYSHGPEPQDRDIELPCHVTVDVLRLAHGSRE